MLGLQRHDRTTCRLRLSRSESPLAASSRDTLTLVSSGLRLPGWATDDAASIEREAQPFRDMTPEQRAHLLARVCRAGARLLRSRADAAAVAALRDPLPESTVRALERLRAQGGAR